MTHSHAAPGAASVSIHRRLLLLPVIALLVSVFPAVAAGPAAQPRIKTLVVDGFSNHDWCKTTTFIKSTLTGTGLFEVTVSTSPATPDAPEWAGWRPVFSDYDLVVMNCNSMRDIRWPRRVEQDLEEYVRGGGGLLIFHSANNSFMNWTEYNRMIGLGWRDKDYGVALQLDPDGKINRIPPGTGEKTSHGPRQDTVVIRHTDHPITKGMPKRWLTPDIEVYTYARGPAENLTVLSYGRHQATDTYWPLEWVVAYGKGRVYNSSFGHIWKDDEGIPGRVLCVGFQTSFIRAAEWLATEKATYPIPKNFPTETQIKLTK